MHPSRKNKAERPRLRAIPGGKHLSTPSVGELFTGRVKRGAEPRAKRRKRETPPQLLPKQVQSVADILVSGRVVEKEIKFKTDYAKQQIDRYCLRDFVRRYIAGSRRPSSGEYIAPHSRFKFVMTSRTTLTVEKVEALKALGISIEEHTELREMQIDYDAIRQHGLQNKLIHAFENMNIPRAVLDEVLVPKVELKETFYDLLLEIVRNSLTKNENLEDKMTEVMSILNPAEQIRNTEALGLDPRGCFDLVYKAKIETSE